MMGVENTQATSQGQSQEQPRPQPANLVLLNVYDMGDSDFVRKLNGISMVKDILPIGGIYHAGVEVYGLEWGYGCVEDESEEEVTGVSANAPRGNPYHTYRVTVEMGLSPMSEEAVKAMLNSLMEGWRMTDYDLIHRNCLAFCNTFCEALGVGRIPGWVDRFGRTASSVDELSRRVGGTMRKTGNLASGVSKTLAQKMASARNEAPKAAAVARSSAQSITQGMKRWYFAAQRVVSDRKASAKTQSEGNDSASTASASSSQQSKELKVSLRNRGGVTPKRRTDADSECTERRSDAESPAAKRTARLRALRKAAEKAAEDAEAEEDARPRIDSANSEACSIGTEDDEAAVRREEAEWLESQRLAAEEARRVAAEEDAAREEEERKATEKVFIEKARLKEEAARHTAEETAARLDSTAAEVSSIGQGATEVRVADVASVAQAELAGEETSEDEDDEAAVRREEAEWLESQRVAAEEALRVAAEEDAARK